MKYIFLIATEHHLFQVVAAKKHFSLSKENSILLVMNVGDIPKFIDRVRGETNFSEVHIFDSWIFKDLLFRRKAQQEFIKYCKSLKNKNQDYTFFFSQYESDPDLLFLSIVQPKTQYLMDEGSASFTVVHNRSKENFQFTKTIKLALKSILYFNKISHSKNVTFFSKYDLQIKTSDRLEKYKIGKLKNPYKLPIKTEAAFLGTSISDIGMVEEEVYLSYLKTIFNKNADKELFYYYPHRKERSEKLKKIEAVGFVIKDIGIPFETFFEKQTACPELICSFFTTGVLDNISKSNAHIPRLKVYKFNTHLLAFDKEVYNSIYKEMSKNKDLCFEEI
jgi:hypothetical protein